MKAVYQRITLAMFRKANLKLLIFLFLFINILGCSQGSVRTFINNKASINKNTTLELRPAINLTAAPMADKVLYSLTNNIYIQLTSRDIATVQFDTSEKNVIVVKNEIFNYKECNKVPLYGIITTMALRNTMCEVRTKLIDKSTNALLAEISTTKKVPGCYTDPNQDNVLLEKIANDIANEIEKIVR